MFELAMFLQWTHSPLKIRGGYTGVSRHPRNILGFHDGVANLPSGLRKSVIEVADGSFKESTFLCFLRLPFNLNIWPGSLETQSRWVGREKRTGAAILAGGALYPKNMRAGDQITDRARVGERDAPPPVLEKGHVEAAQSNHFKVFRQGYEFLEIGASGAWDAGPQVGLNFVSFQNSPAVICGLLNKMGTGFGKLADEHVPFITADAGGLFFVPSKPLLSELLRRIPAYPITPGTSTYRYMPLALDILWQLTRKQ
jgi:deferrochelatase/peroxidase EfeB